jgi:predicted ArsR family transcriptional regulator
MSRNQPLYTSDLAQVLRISPEAARRKIKAVKEKTKFHVISVGDYLAHTATSPSIFGI